MVNAGTIGAASADENMTINGNLSSNGRLQAYGGGPTAYEMRGRQDKTHLLLSLTGENEFAPGGTLSGDAVLERGGHDRDVMCAVTLRRMW